MRKTVTTYVCDGCGKATKDGRSLRKFSLVYRARGRASDQYASADLCADCETRLMAAVEPLMGSDVLDLQRAKEPELVSEAVEATGRADG